MAQRYPPEFRQRAVELARLRDKPITHLAADLGISDATLHAWLKQADIDEGRREGLTSEERAELVRLRRSNRVLRWRTRSSSVRPRSSRARTCSQNDLPAGPGACRWRGARRGGLPGVTRLSLGLLTVQIREIHACSRGTYGTPRVHAELRLGRGVRCSRKRVARLMGRRVCAAFTGADGGGQVRLRRCTRTWCGGALSLTRRTGCGSRTSPSTRRARGRSTGSGCSTSTLGASAAGRSPTTCAVSSSWTRWRWRAGGGVRHPARRCSTLTAAHSTPRGPSATGCATPPRVNGPRRLGLRQRDDGVLLQHVATRVAHLN
jgi:transposase-like protein